MIPFIRRTLLMGFMLLITLGLLEWALPVLGIPAFVLPTPMLVAAHLIDPQNDLLYHSMITFIASAGGFLLGSIVGFGIAVIFLACRTIEDAFYPWVLVVQTVPLVAIAPLLIIWFGNGLSSRIVMAALFTFFPVLLNAIRGFRQVRPETLDLLSVYAISGWQRFWLVQLPNSLPFLFTGLKIASTLAVAGAIIAEFEGAGRGLGFVITISTYHMETARTFAAVVAASLLSLAWYGVLVGLERWLIFWHEVV